MICSSNRKGGNTSSLNTQLSARGYDVTTNSAAKVEKTYKNPPIPDAKNSETDAEVFLREGDGVVSDAVLSEENDALGKMGIERTEEERAAFAERERARMERMAHRVAEELGLDEDAVQVVTDVNEITEPKLRKAKGWFDPKTGKITVVIPNTRARSMCCARCCTRPWRTRVCEACLASASMCSLTMCMPLPTRRYGAAFPRWPPSKGGTSAAPRRNT